MTSPPWPASAADEPDHAWRDALCEARKLLDRHGRLAVTGAWGTGKSTLLDALAGSLPDRPSLRIRAVPGDQDLPFGALTQLLGSPCVNARDLVPDSVPATSFVTSPAVPPCPLVPTTSFGPVTDVERSLRAPGPLPHRVPATDLEPGAPAGPARTGDPRLAMRLALTRVLGSARPVLLLVDGAEWLDAASAQTLAHVLGTLPAGRLAAVATERTTAFPQAAARLLGGHPPVFPLRPLTVTDTAELLGRRALPARWAAGVHGHCGGHRALTEEYLRAAAQDPARYGPQRPPAAVRDRAEVWLSLLPGGVRTTLRAAALVHRPNVALLRDAGCPDAEDHLGHAVAAGAVSAPDPYDLVRFTAGALAEAAAAAGTSAERAGVHRALADAVPDPVQRARHLALARHTADTGTAQDTDDASAVARADGDRQLAAELLLLAARLTPADRAALRLDRLARAADDASAAGRPDLARQAARALDSGRAGRGRRVRALLAVVDAQGQDLSDLETDLAEARRLADGDPALLAAVELRAAIGANVTQGVAAVALHHAGTAAALAAQARDVPLQAAALTMRARTERLCGRHDDAERTLVRALALAVPPGRIGIRNSPEYLAARHALFDDRLRAARAQFLALLPQAGRTGGAEDLVDLWRSLAEAEVRLGSCAAALQWAHRALERTAGAGLSPGPAWYTAAVAHSHGGSFSQARQYALQAVRASREEHDSIHTARGLWILGAVHLHTGDAESAAVALGEVADLEAAGDAADPGSLRWQADAVEALTAVRREGEARALLEAAHAGVGTHDRHAGLRAALTRARAGCVRAAGRTDEAAELLDDAARSFAALDMPVEQGRTLLARGRLERGRRRQAAARTAWQQAREVFREAEAAPWLALAEAALERLSGHQQAAAQSPAGLLTENERRLAALIGHGATNRQAADRMYVSVKTVESMLSRIYRKAGVRSRTQLLTRLTQGPPL
ncbi:helix-turn-helix transcriptional regulator [Streptomyces candidus]|uniref:DNA-binding CsgD family transcriptional regulator/energy-coupling factor transporter ATP-binding protein EcfA2 n=1 Tax=Streptomyces candidus TaxID=67283 RepID=A0A7X0LPJ0_9ACTN|nr:LuxR family transcriptional regulator [Streptomyces candidus]MBB6436017.1 DNA-binding CsgD family transcriptional regulator/energy-coupling factor transporter ATP-binding protein EcfA2 [Streptomyces candidus]GHH43354.1 transcriptional regulator [Streptomyces candidus]